MIKKLLLLIVFISVSLPVITQEVYTIRKTEGNLIEMPFNIKNGDLLKVVGDTLIQSDWEKLMSVKVEYHLDINTANLATWKRYDYSPNNTLLSFTAPNIKVITYAAFYSFRKLKEINCNNLEYVDHDFATGNILEKLVFPKMEKMKSNVIGECQTIKSLFFPRLVYIDSDAIISELPNCKDISLPNLKHIGSNNFYLLSSDALVCFPSLVQTNWLLSDYNNYYYPFFPRLQMFEGLGFLSNGNFQSLYYPKVKVLDVRSVSNGVVRSLALPGLQQITNNFSQSFIFLEMLYAENPNPTIDAMSFKDNNIDYPFLFLTSNTAEVNLASLNMPTTTKIVKANVVPTDFISLSPGETLSLSIDIEEAKDFRWTKNGKTIAGVTSSSYIIENVNELDFGDYAVNFTIEGIDYHEYTFPATRVVVGTIPTISGPQQETICSHRESYEITFPYSGLDSLQMSGRIPWGMTFDPIKGTLSGIPVESGTFHFYFYGDNVYSKHLGEYAEHEFILQIEDGKGRIIKSSVIGEGGTISPQGEIKCQMGSDLTLEFIPEDDYQVEKLWIDGVQVAFNGKNYTFTQIENDHTLEVSFAKKVYNITATANTKGTVSPKGDINVAEGGSQKFVFSPSDYCSLRAVYIDGVKNEEAKKNGEYTFTEVSEPHSIQVMFGSQNYIIQAIANDGVDMFTDGNINIAHGTNRLFTFSAKEGYYISEVLIDGVSNPEAITSGEYTFINITDDHSIVVSAARYEENRKQYTINASVGLGGIISPQGEVKVYEGTDQTFLYMLYDDVSLYNVLVDEDIAYPSVWGTYTFKNVTSDHTLYVATEEVAIPEKCTITASSGKGGSISPEGQVKVAKGNDKTFTFTPDEGYAISNVVIDDYSNQQAIVDGYYTFTNIERWSHRIKVFFIEESKISYHTVTVLAGEGGSVFPQGKVKVRDGFPQNVEIVPDEGYQIHKVYVNGVERQSEVVNGVYAIPFVTEKVIMNVEFIPSHFKVTATVGEGGFISPEGEVMVGVNEDQEFIFAPEEGYSIGEVYINNSRNPKAKAMGKYTFYDVLSEHSIHVEFVSPMVLPKYYIVTANTGIGGSISPKGMMKVAVGGDQVFDFTPSLGYKISKVYINGEENAEAAEAGSYKFVNVREPEEIYVEFTINDVEQFEPTYLEELENLLNTFSQDNCLVKPEFHPNTLEYFISIPCETNAYKWNNIYFNNMKASSIFAFPKAGTKTIELEGDVGEQQTVKYKLHFTKPFDNSVLKVWDNVLTVVNNPDNNGGYTFAEYQWYADKAMTKKLENEVSGNLIVDNVYNIDSYTVWLKATDGTEACGCLSNLSTLRSSQIRLYPNPVINELNIEYPNWEDNPNIQVYDITGNAMLKMEADSQYSKINTSNWTTGLYMLRVGSESFVIMKNR
ncbi:hypothetical protein M2138_001990 [Dysgonomonadaceae bacterium PH5-43]|nr:hypothetical protein [Dysgonomonadaceae bacterium PH5-43]